MNKLEVLKNMLWGYLADYDTNALELAYWKTRNDREMILRKESTGGILLDIIDNLADVLDITLIVKPEVQRSPYGGELIKYERLLIAE